MELYRPAAQRPQEHLGLTGSSTAKSELSDPSLRDAVTCQKQGEYVEDFFLRIKTHAQKCKYASEATTQERLLEQLIAGTNIQKVQQELPSKDNTLTLKQVLDIAKADEASIKHMKQIQDLTPSSATSTIDAVSNYRVHKQRGNCGGTHVP